MPLPPYGPLGPELVGINDPTRPRPFAPLTGFTAPAPQTAPAGYAQPPLNDPMRVFFGGPSPLGVLDRLRFRRPPANPGTMEAPPVDLGGFEAPLGIGSPSVFPSSDSGVLLGTNIPFSMPPSEQPVQPPQSPAAATPPPDMPEGPAVPLTGPQAAGVQPPDSLAAAADRAQADAPRTRADVPPELYDLIKSEAEKRNIPLNWAMALFQVESNFDPSAVNPTSGAGGLGQILASTARSPGFGMSPISDQDRFDPAKSVPFALDYLMARGRSMMGDSFDPQNPQHLALATRVYGENTDEYVAKVAKAAGVNYTPGGQSQGPRPDSPQTPQGPQPTDYEAMLPQIPSQMNQQNVMLALASGLLQGPTFGEGLGKGVERMLGLSKQDGDAAIQRARAIAQMRLNEPLRDIQRGRLDEQRARTTIMELNSRLRGQSLTLQGERIAQGWAAQGLRADEIALKLEKMNDAKNPVLQGDIASAKAAGTTYGKQAAEAVGALMETGEIDSSRMADIETARAAITRDPNVYGGTMKGRVLRTLASLGLTDGAGDIDAVRKALTQYRNDSLISAMNGHVGAFRSNAELNNVSAAYADVATTPETAMWLLDVAENRTKFNTAWRKYVTSALADPERRREVEGANYRASLSQFADMWHQQNPLPVFDPEAYGRRVRGGTSGAATGTPAPARPTSGRVGNVTWEAVPD